jgi:heme/copper-type cytochrome/quinol oxidase subunit 1
MYTLVRRFIKTGIAFLFLGLAIGAWMQVQRDIFNVWPNPYMKSAHIHTLLVGFVMFLILGVALWLFPRPAPDDPRYTPSRITAAYWILVSATMARVVGELGRAYGQTRWFQWLALIGGLGQIVGLAVYFWSMWGRIRPTGSKLREANGERF